MAAEDTDIRPAFDLLEEPAHPSDPTTISRPAAPDDLNSLAVETPPVGQDKTVISTRPPIAASDGTLAPLPQLLGSALVGKRLEHYELNEFVGGGGMGAVFRATDTRLGRIVAVKVLSRDHTDEETIRRFKNEAQSAARLDHPNIARVYYVGEDHGWNFIVFEFIEGTNLRDEVERNGPLELEQALDYTLQVAEALAHSSSRDIVHRDIKPSNVLVMASGQIKLVDMGLARLHHVESSADDLTASGVTLGTFDYISPEQGRDPRAADVRSDIYSLGCTLFYMLTGQPPFPEGTALQKLLRHNSDDPPDIRAFRPELHPRASGLVAKMLSKRPSQRQQSAAELMADIVGLGQQLGLKSIAEYGHIVVVPAASAGPWWSKAWQVLAAVALLAALIVGREIFLSPRQSSGDVIQRPRFRPLPVSPTPANTSSASDPAPDTDDGKPDGAAGLQARRSATSSQTAIEASGYGNRASPSIAQGTKTEPPGQPSKQTQVSPLDDAAHAAERSSTGGSTSAGHTAGSATASDEGTRHIVVLTEAPAPSEPRTEYMATLAEACARAAELGLNEVELRFSGPRIEQPLELTSQRLTVRPAPGYRPVIIFRPQVRAGDHHMIRLAGGSLVHVAMEGIELRLELPADPPADGWSLFSMSTGQSLDLTECVLTVQDGSADHSPIHDQVAMIAVQRRRSGEAMTMSDPQLAMGQQARITLERTIARGEASLVTLTDETPLTLRWNQGLLITSKHLIETGGSATEPQYYEQIVLDFDNLTACCRQGMYHLRRGSGKAYQFHVKSYANNCIFVTDAGVPLFEMVGLSTPPETDELQSTGDGNRFSPLDMPFLSIRASASAEPQTFKLGRVWSSEPRSQAGVPWLRSPPLDHPAHELTKSNFEIDSDPAAGGAGFDPLLLPDASSSTSTAAAPTSPAGTNESAAALPPSP